MNNILKVSNSGIHTDEKISISERLYTDELAEIHGKFDSFRSSRLRTIGVGSFFAGMFLVSCHQKSYFIEKCACSGEYPSLK